MRAFLIGPYDNFEWMPRGEVTIIERANNFDGAQTAEFGRNPEGGVTRLGFSQTEMDARTYVMSLMKTVRRSEPPPVG
jgi:hypothetical protein